MYAYCPVAEYLGQSIDFSAQPAGSAATGSWLSASRSTQSAVFRQVMSAGIHHNPFQELLHYSAFQTLRFAVSDKRCLLQFRIKTVLEVIMDFPASSSIVPTNSQLPCSGQQPARTRKNKTPRVVPGQQRLLRRGRSAGMPAAERSLEVVGDRCRRQSAGALRRTTPAQPPSLDSGSLDVRFEEGDITLMMLNFVSQ